MVAVFAALCGLGGISDLVQDVAGARALLNHTAAYLPIEQEAASFGLDWPVLQTSTHPPTAFLFLLPLANLSWPAALQLWAVFMLLALGLSAWAYGVSARYLPLLLPVLLWPPTVTSFGQLTPLWLLGVGLAWRFRQRGIVAGAFLAAAALTKGLPLIGLVPLMRMAHGRNAVLGAAAIVGLAVGALLLIEPNALAEYLTAGRDALAYTVARPDNGALLPFAFQLFGVGGLLASLILTGVIAVKSWRALNEVDAWAGWTWLGVALLPIAWTYSLLPLLPWLLGDLRSPVRRVRVLAALALLVPFLGAAPSSNPIAVALALTLEGLAIICRRGASTALNHPSDLRATI